MHGMTRIVAIVSVLRDITGGALTGLVVGIVVLGIGGRIVMRLATVLDPASAGQLTENGNVIGDVTIEGTVALVFFGGILTGLAAAVIWIAIQAWIPGDRWARAVLSMPIAVALTGFQLVRPENSDFFILEPVAVVVALLLGLAAVAGFAFAIVFDGLDRGLPPVTERPTRMGITYGILVVIGLVLVVPLSVQMFFVPGFAAEVVPIPSSIFIAAAGVVTLAAWVVRVASGDLVPPRPLRVLGSTMLALAVALGAWHLFGQIGQVVSYGT
jgi:hypothetical protein